MVATEQGLRPIEELKIGDKVWAKDPTTGEQGYHPITWLTNHTADEVVQITVADQSSNSLNVAAGILLASELGSASGSSSGPAPNQEVIEATAAHPFWVIGKGWTDAGKLVPGDKLLARDSRLLTVSDTRLVKKSVQVYNFTVDQLHTYFVGQQQALVHNIDPCSQEELNLAQQAISAKPLIGKVPSKKVVAAAQYGGRPTRSLSGWTKKEFYVQKTEDVLRDGNLVGFNFPSQGAIDGGVSGRWFASHAEKQLPYVVGNKPMAVSKHMCSNCQDWFEMVAHETNATFVVADPKVVRIFRPNGLQTRLVGWGTMTTGTKTP